MSDRDFYDELNLGSLGLDCADSINYFVIILGGEQHDDLTVRQLSSGDSGSGCVPLIHNSNHAIKTGFPRVLLLTTDHPLDSLLPFQAGMTANKYKRDCQTIAKSQFPLPVPASFRLFRPFSLRSPTLIQQLNVQDIPCSDSYRFPRSRSQSQIASFL